ncbi:MAG: hypothetical protein IJW57_08635 [Spirochaetaceae bacterium]|nr:hypothetical protein [Spirochaetaceae bacterium]
MPQKTCDQQAYSSVAHTRMALRMLGDGKAIQMTESLDMDITAYKLSQHLGDESIFAGYVAGNYDASADYWKLMDDGMHKLDGIRAGEVIGRMGNTGANSTGAHAHMSINGRGDLFAEKFNQSFYKDFFQADDYALYLSGYETKSFSDNLQLWNNVKKFSEQRPDLLNFDDFKEQHFNEVPLLFQ